jgi:hypothetical protein
MQFQNLIILNFVVIMFFLAMVHSLALIEFALVKCILCILIVIFTLLLFTKKGLAIEKSQLYTGVFLFSRLIFKKEVPTNFKSFTLFSGRLSTNYNYSYEITDFHNWEPDLNVSKQCYSLNIVSEDHRKRLKVLTLTKIDKAKEAVDFIVKHTALQYEKYSPK